MSSGFQFTFSYHLWSKNSKPNTLSLQFAPAEEKPARECFLPSLTGSSPPTSGGNSATNLLASTPRPMAKQNGWIRNSNLENSKLFPLCQGPRISVFQLDLSRVCPQHPAIRCHWPVPFPSCLRLLTPFVHPPRSWRTPALVKCCRSVWRSVSTHHPTAGLTISTVLLCHTVSAKEWLTLKISCCKLTPRFVGPFPISKILNPMPFASEYLESRESTGHMSLLDHPRIYKLVFHWRPCADFMSHCSWSVDYRVRTFYVLLLLFCVLCVDFISRSAFYQVWTLYIVIFCSVDYCVHLLTSPVPMVSVHHAVLGYPAIVCLWILGLLHSACL